VPELPTPDEQTDASFAESHPEAVVFSAIDPRFDQHLVSGMALVVEVQIPFFTPTLSRLSRNQDKLLKIIEYLLAHDVSILTTNYLLRSHEVWVRRRPFVVPDSWDPNRGLEDERGLSGAHRAVARTVRTALALQDGPDPSTAV